jgi:hypothetical protein
VQWDHCALLDGTRLSVSVRRSNDDFKDASFGVVWTRYGLLAVRCEMYQTILFGLKQSARWQTDKLQDYNSYSINVQGLGRSVSGLVGKVENVGTLDAPTDAERVETHVKGLHV